MIVVISNNDCADCRETKRKKIDWVPGLYKVSRLRLCKVLCKDKALFEAWKQGKKNIALSYCEASIYMYNIIETEMKKLLPIKLN